MQNEYIQRMSELANKEITDIPTINILICCLLYKTRNEITTDDLYAICINSGFMNYFSFQEALDHIVSHKLAEVVDGKYHLLDDGVICAETLRNCVSKSYRDNLILTALRYYSCEKLKHEVTVEYEAVDKGCYVRVNCKDKTHNLMNLKLFAPDMNQAKIIGDKINVDPVGFYKRVMNLVLFNEEIAYDLSDN